MLVDSNVLLHAADQHSPFHAPCAAYLERLRSQPLAWFTTWPICYEFLRVSTHARALRSPLSFGQAWSFLEVLFESPGLQLLVPTDRHPAILQGVLNEIPSLAGNIMHDVHTVVLMREHGIRQVCTRDTHFHRFSGIEIFDPAKA